MGITFGFKKSKHFKLAQSRKAKIFIGITLFSYYPRKADNLDKIMIKGKARKKKYQPQ